MLLAPLGVAVMGVNTLSPSSGERKTSMMVIVILGSAFPLIFIQKDRTLQQWERAMLEKGAAVCTQFAFNL